MRSDHNNSRVVIKSNFLRILLEKRIQFLFEKSANEHGALITGHEVYLIPFLFSI